MLLIKEIRQHTRTPYGPQDWDATSVEGASQLGSLDTRTRDKHHILENQGSDLYPQEVMLRARAVAIPFDNQETTFAFAVNEKSYAPLSFYGQTILEKKQSGFTQHGQFAQAHLMTTGGGVLYMHGGHKLLGHTPHVLKNPHAPLMVKTFMRQTRSHLFERRTEVSPVRWVTTPAYGGGAISSGVCLMPYGGYMKEGRGIDAIDQLFASLEKTRESGWRFALRSLKELRTNNILPPQGGTFDGTKYVFLDTFAREDHLSFSGMIDAGYARTTLTCTDGTAASYVSWRYEQNDPGSGLINVYFKKQQGPEGVDDEYHTLEA